MKFLYVILFCTHLLLGTAKAWKLCPSGVICPDENRCCGKFCLPGSKGSAADSQCCNGNQTGCGQDFECGLDGSDTCTLSPTATEDLPDQVPRYKLCQIDDPAMLQSVYGLPMDPQEKKSRNFVREEKSNSHVAAYLSNKGPVHSTTNERLESIQNAVILIHGSLRNSDDYLCCVSSAVPHDLQHDTLLIAPWFLAPEDGAVNMTSAEATQNDSEPLRWVARGVAVEHTWRFGADAINASVSSYAVVDQLITLLQDKQRFPNLDLIVVAGHSAGGQFAQRWGLLSAKANDVRIVAANPKSFAYLDGRRFVRKTVFRVPEPKELDGCTSYNEWEWGFGSTNFTAVQAPYKDAAIAAAGGVDAVIDRYAERDVIYLSGEQDVIWNGHCEAMAQGINRLNRSSFFFQSLEQVYGRTVHQRWTVPNVHHDHCLMFQSPQGQLALFGKQETKEEERPYFDSPWDGIQTNRHRRIDH